MTHVDRITITGEVTIGNAQIFSLKESIEKGFKNYFEEAQLMVKSAEGTHLLPSYTINLILLDKKRTKFNPKISRKFQRITISGNMSYNNCWVLDPGKHKEANVPLIFQKYEQFTFACKDGLYITSDFNITAIEI